MNYTDQTNFRKKLAKDAVAARKRMRGLDKKAAFTFVKGIIDDAEVAFGVWHDPKQSEGIGVRTIKGLNRLRDLIADNESRELRIGVVPCIEEEQAIAAESIFGDKTQ